MSSSSKTYATSAAADNTVTSVVDNGSIKTLISQGNAVLATNLLASALARAIRIDGLMNIDHTEIEDEDELLAAIEHSLMGGSEPYNFIHDIVTSLDTETQVGLIEGHPPFFETYRFDSNSGNIDKDIAITSTHAVRDQVWNLLFEYHTIEDEKAKEKEHTRLDALFADNGATVSVQNILANGGHVEKLIENNQPVLATYFLASALAREIHLDGCIDIADNAAEDDTSHTISEEMNGQGDAYERIYNVVSSYPTNIKVAFLRGNQPFYEKYGFEAGSNDIHNEITYAATHAVRNLVWNMMLKYHGVGDDEVEEEGRTPTDVLLSTSASS